MNDKELMENMLILEKSACDLFMHGTIESSSADVRGAFSNSLNASLDLQNKIYSKMSAKGWYPTEQADSTKQNSVKQKFCAGC